MHRNLNFPNTVPLLDEFLEWSCESISKVAPSTVMLDADGTRRRAALAGISPNSQAYAQFSRDEMFECFQMLFAHGVRHVFTGAVMATNLQEVTQGYREKLSAWVDWGLAGPEALAEYNSRRWKVQLIGTEDTPEFQKTADKLRDKTSQNDGPRVWFSITSHPDAHWDAIFDAATRVNQKTRSAIIKEIYGEEIPLATLYLGSGKPEVSAVNVPLILIGNLQCYWRQHLGYHLDQTTLRKILYDYAYQRKTWQKDKGGRAEEAIAFRNLWENPPVLGVGQKVGPFWYPELEQMPSD